MAFATTEDIEARLGRTLTGTEAGSVDLLLEAAQAVIAQAAGKTDEWAETLDPVPAILRFVCVELVVRVLANPEGLRSTSEQLGAYQRSRSFRDADGLLLTASETRLVRGVTYGRASGSARMKSILDDLHPSCGS